MKKTIQSIFLAVIALTFLLGGCAPASTPVPATTAPSSVPSTITPSPVPPSHAPEPTETLIPNPSGTPLPGSLVIPLDKLGKSVPWLPIDKSARPSTYFFYFNVSKPPFDNALVRQAFAAAVDREALAEVAKQYKVKNPRPATTLTPPDTLGRDLYNTVGIPFNPQRARDLLMQAGYTDANKFPPSTLLIGAADSDVPGFHAKMAETIVNMWQQNLGVKITIETLDFNSFVNRIATNPPEIFRAIVYAYNNDPDDFLTIFHTGAKFNFGRFSNPEFDQLIDLAAKSEDPAKRQELYIQAERIVCETDTALLPIYHSVYP